MSGKLYNREKAIISLTSWKARIHTVGLTIYSLLMNCPGFHIVLVLCEEEFPTKEQELPRDLKILLRAKIIEILWVQKNYKAFKKVLFTMDKYRSVPVISADDDCIYICNYAQELYEKWREDTSVNGIRYEWGKFPQMQGPTSLYYGFGDKALKIIDLLSPDVINISEDDKVIYKYMQILNCKFSYVHKHTKKPYKFHDTISPLHSDEEYKKLSCFRSAFNR